MYKSIIIKLFLFITVNMTFLTFFINLNLQNHNTVYEISQAIPGWDVLFFAGKYTDISKEWYVNVGIAIFTLAITNLIIANGYSWVYQL